jgi:hypothetical protein
MTINKSPGSTQPKNQKKKKKTKTPSKQLETGISDNTTGVDGTSTLKKLLQNDSSRKVTVQKHHLCPVKPQ